MEDFFIRNKKNIYYPKKRNSLTGFTNKSHKKGFSLIETLVAISILTIVISATLSLAQRGLSTAGAAKEQMVAFYLAVEGMEFVRHQRALNVLDPGPVNWLDSLGPPGSMSKCFNIQGCTVDVHAGAVLGCSGGCDPLQYNAGDNEYGYGNGGDNTIYVRKAIISEPELNQEAIVTVTVSWQSGSFGSREVVLEERLLNWTDF